MATAPVDVMTRYPVRRHRLTRRDYYALGEAGILGKDDRVELEEGQLVDLAPIGPRHAIVIENLMDERAAPRTYDERPIIAAPQDDVPVAPLCAKTAP